MDRRTWLRSTAVFAAATFGARFVSTAHVARAATPPPGPDGVKRIGVLHQFAQDATAPPEASKGLAERGWVEGRNLEFVKRAAKPDGSDLDALARDLANVPVDLFLTFGTPATLAAKRATSSIPVLFSLAVDPVSSGIVRSLAKPGTNCTGTFFGIYEEKLLEVLQRVIPTVHRVLFSVSQPHPEAYRAAEKLKVDIRGFPMRASGLDAFFAAIRKDKPDGVVVINDAWIDPHLARIARGIAATGTPSICALPRYTREGGLLSYGPTGAGMLARRLQLIDALLRGANPADMPVEMPTQFHLGVNMATAKALRVQIPNWVLTTADPADVIRE